jgi:hypothetical protein
MLCCAFVALTVQLYAQLYELIAVRVACGSCMLYPCIMYVGCLSLWAALLPVCRRVPVLWRALACFRPSVQPVSGTDGTRRNCPCHNLRSTKSGILSIMACWFLVVPCPLCSIRECKAGTQGAVGSSKAIDIGHTTVAPCPSPSRCAATDTDSLHPVRPTPTANQGGDTRQGDAISGSSKNVRALWGPLHAQ